LILINAFEVVFNNVSDYFNPLEGLRRFSYLSGKRGETPSAIWRIGESSPVIPEVRKSSKLPLGCPFFTSFLWTRRVPSGNPSSKEMKNKKRIKKSKEKND